MLCSTSIGSIALADTFVFRIVDVSDGRTSGKVALTFTSLLPNLTLIGFIVAKGTERVAEHGEFAWNIFEVWMDSSCGCFARAGWSICHCRGVVG
jgi:hypothetical protein